MGLCGGTVAFKLLSRFGSSKLDFVPSLLGTSKLDTDFSDRLLNDGLGLSFTVGAGVLLSPFCSFNWSWEAEPMLTELFTELERVEFCEAVLEVGTVSVLESSDILSSKLETVRIVEFIRERAPVDDRGDAGAESSDLPLAPLTDDRDITALIVPSEACARVEQGEPAARSITERANESLCIG